MVKLLHLFRPLYLVLPFLLFIFGSILTITPAIAQQAADLYIRDNIGDDGTEPNPDTGAMYVSPDIWVRNIPHPGYQNTPFTGTTPPWTVLPHENPEYRDPLHGNPNYVYVLVQNRGIAPSTGTERLRLYWSKASTGLAWDIHWDDYVASDGAGSTALFGAEATEPRKNAATATAAERTAYINAIIAAASRIHPTSGGPASADYWALQEAMHALSAVQTNAHTTPAFLPWHREMINRLELMLQEIDPTVNLLYWDWTTNPSNSTGGFNYYNTAFMGANSPTVSAPFNGALGPIARFAPNTAPQASTGSDVNAITPLNYQNLRFRVENDPYHNATHRYFSDLGPLATVTDPDTAPRDPFFFLLHTNVDRLWAMWQRNSLLLPMSSATALQRMTPATAYGLDSGNANIVATMTPWNANAGLSPWTSAGGYVLNKDPRSRSIVYPPTYDTASLTIPVLQPGQSVILEIPWYPPNPNDFAALGGDQSHFCLLARIETAATSPFGMSTTETTDVNFNTRENNNIAWKNVTVVNNFLGAQPVALLLRNVFEEEVRTQLRFANVEGTERSFFDFGTIFVELGPELFERWRNAGGAGEGIEVIDEGTIQIFSPEAALTDILLLPGELFSVNVRFALNPDYEFIEGVVPEWDFMQIGTPQDPEAIVGGQRFVLDFSKITLVEPGGTWRYLDFGVEPDGEWRFPGFDDSKWRVGEAELGFGDDPVTTLESGPPGEVQTVRYFRRTFQVDDLSMVRNLMMRLKRNDGAIVYLNGNEIHRVNVSDEGSLLADQDVTGLERDLFFPIDEIDPGLLNPEGAENVVAVEIYLASRESEDLSFDLELYANVNERGTPPVANIVSPRFGELIQINQMIPIEVEALDPDGGIAAVRFYIDNELIEEVREAPYIVEWFPDAVGVYQLQAVAIDQEGSNTSAPSYTTISILENVPPSVELFLEEHEDMRMSNEPIRVSAQAFDEHEEIAYIEIYLVDHSTFLDPKLVATLETTPFDTRLELSELPPGHYSLFALAYDESGLHAQSAPVMVMITGE